MKEEEAKTKWCPQVRFHSGADGGVYSNVIGGGTDDDCTKCIASDCMMWVSTDNESDAMQNNSSISEPKSYPAGRCGLVK